MNENVNVNEAVEVTEEATKSGGAIALGVCVGAFAVYGVITAGVKLYEIGKGCVAKAKDKAARKKTDSDKEESLTED